MSFFTSIGRIAGKIILAPYTITKDIIDGTVEALDDLIDEE